MALATVSPKFTPVNILLRMATVTGRGYTRIRHVFLGMAIVAASLGMAACQRKSCLTVMIE